MMSRIMFGGSLSATLVGFEEGNLIGRSGVVNIL
jgi:hypothetical protein